MSVRINPAKLLLWRSTDSLQFGLADPVVLENVTPEAERLLRLLERGVADDSPEVQDVPLLERLAPALLQPATLTKPQLDGDFIRGAFAELIRASYATNVDGLAVLEARAKQTIHINSLTPGGFLVVLGLAAAGVGRILTSDRGTVTEHELGPLTYPRESLNQTRIAAVNQVLANRPGGTKVFDFESQTPAKARHKLRVIVTHNAVAPSQYRRLSEPHVAVFFGEDWVSVSPKIAGSPCLGCLDLAKTDADPLWPTLASQLIGRRDHLEDARGTLFAASMVVGEILRALDSPEHESEFLGHRLQVSSGRVEPWTWAKHPACECH